MIPTIIILRLHEEYKLHGYTNISMIPTIIILRLHENISMIPTILILGFHVEYKHDTNNNNT